MLVFWERHKKHIHINTESLQVKIMSNDQNVCRKHKKAHNSIWIQCAFLLPIRFYGWKMSVSHPQSISTMSYNFMKEIELLLPVDMRQKRRCLKREKVIANLHEVGPRGWVGFLASQPQTHKGTEMGIKEFVKLTPMLPLNDHDQKPRHRSNIYLSFSLARGWSNWNAFAIFF